MALLLVGLGLVVVWTSWRIIKLYRSDADLAFLSKGPLPDGAFDNKVVWITGASQGIGEAVAGEFARLGARLILSARGIERLEKVKALCPGKHGPDGVALLPLDLAGGSEALKQAVVKAEACFDGAGIDFLVHNAAYPRPKLTCEETSEDLLRGMFEVNVFGTIELTRAALPGMRRRRCGHITVEVSSAAGKVPSPAQGVYAATKHALQGYFHSLRYELVPDNVGVTLVCPGPIATSPPPPPPAGDAPASSAGPAETEQGRMAASRCAELIVAATGHRLTEAWISPQPVLAFMYVMQYLPSVGHMLMRKIGPKRVSALKEGQKDLYNSSLLFGGSSKQPSSKIE